MKHLNLAICYAAALAIAPVSAHSDILGQSYRPPAPTEPSVVIAEKPATVKPAVEAPKPVVRHRIVHRIGKVPAGPVTVPPSEALIMMVRGVLASVNQANFTENYSVLHGMTTQALQARVSAAQFGRAFADLRKQNLDLSPALVLSPQFTAPPAITPQGVLKLTGNFPSRPWQIDFAIDFRPVDGFWLIDTLSVSVVPAVASAPVARLVAPARPTASPAPVHQAATPARPAFWDARFTRATQFGPGYRFAANPP